MKKSVIVVLIIILICALSVFLQAVWHAVASDDETVADDSLNIAATIGPSPSTEPAATPAPESTPTPKIIYLTFDDGPSSCTERLLNVLDEYDVKATFFVTGTYPEYRDFIKEEYNRGYSVGAHSYSHDLKSVYDNYPQDYEKINAVILEETGSNAEIFRFPGGSSNAIAEEKMPELIEEFTNKGLIYFDWDVDSCDATSAKSKDEVISNLKSGVSESKVYSLILCHDVYDYTIDAIEEFIPWAIENGYVFESLNPSSPQVHHR